MIYILLPLPLGISIERALKIGGGIFSALLILVVIFLTINVMQRGLGGPDGRRVDDILGKPAHEATKTDLDKLSKSELMQLFYAAEAPDPNTLDGEYNGQNIPVAISFPIIKLYEINIYGPPGEWVGKALFGCNKKRCPGYNLFEVEHENGKTTLQKSRKMESFIATSAFDDKRSLVVDYAPYSKDLTKRVVDEIRQINDTLFIGMGYMKFPPGTWHCFPFVLWRD